MKHLKLGAFLLAGGIIAGAWNRLDDSATVNSAQLPQEPVSSQLPAPQSIKAQLLRTPDARGNNLLVTAAFDREDPRLRGVTVFRLQLSDQLTTVLSDNGTNGDARANDGIFTTTLKENPQVLKRTLTEFNTATAARQRSNQALAKFVGRSVELPSNAERVAAVTEPIVLDPGAEATALPINLSSQIASVTLTPADFAALRTNSLMVTHLNVVQDPTRTFNPCVGGTTGGNPNGVWTFKSLMTNMANTPVTGVTADNFVKEWIDTELFGAKTHPVSLDATLNPTPSGPLVVRDNLANLASSKRKFIAAWLKNSGIPINPANVTNWKALLTNKLEFIPLRLLAIVNRVDLRGNFGYGGGTASGGEGRFVFCFMDSNAPRGCSSANGGPGSLTVILEYGVPHKTCSTLLAYAQQWFNLKNLVLGTPAYNNALQAVTDQFTKVNAIPTRPNGSALNHLRTNEFIMFPLIWNIRDFEINSVNIVGNLKFKHLNLIHPNHEPMSEANAAPGGGNNAAKVGLLNTFVNANAVVIANDGAYTIPDNIKGIDAQMPNPSYIWNSAGITNDAARHKLSLGTCSSCHAGETKTSFTHVRPANFGTQAPLSAFLTGLGGDDETTDVDTDPMGFFFVKDPANRPTALTAPKRGFNDLLRRANDLATFVGTSCGVKGPLVSLVAALSFQKMESPH